MFITCSASMLGGAVLVFLLAGYFAQQYLPPPKPKVVGIDLGKIPKDCVSIVNDHLLLSRCASRI